MIKFLKEKEAFTPREGEKRLGQIAEFINQEDTVENQLRKYNSKFVLLGIAEDEGVYQNGGITGTANTPFQAIKAILNTQVLDDNHDKLIVMGILSSAQKVEQTDQELSRWIELIVSCDKTPIIIGGGHNNAFGNIQGLHRAKKEQIGLINIDAHTDFRRLEHRHSGNGFSYAYERGFLKKYFMLGIQSYYTPKEIHNQIQSNPDLEMISYDDLLDGLVNKSQALRFADQHIKECEIKALEIDLDCISFMPSSAMSPSGFNLDEVRYFIRNLCQTNHFSYLHICEGIVDEKKSDYEINLVPKAISYLVRDFMSKSTSAKKE